MREIEFNITEKDKNRQVKDFLRDFGVSHALLVQLKNMPGGITIDNEPAKAIDILKNGNKLKITLPQNGTPPVSSGTEVEILYEDEDIAAVNKPCGMPVHESRNHRGDALSNAFASHLPPNTSFSAVYRLDKDTSGIVLIAKNCLAASKLAGKVKKDYYAVVGGRIEGSGEIRLPVERVDTSIIKRRVGTSGEEAVTKYEVIKNMGGSTLLKINLETGKTHQIRVHFSAIGHPLLGDDLYGGDTSKIKRQALHCRDIYFKHPMVGREMHISCPFPEDFKRLV